MLRWWGSTRADRNQLSSPSFTSQTLSGAQSDCSLVVEVETGQAAGCNQSLGTLHQSHLHIVEEFAENEAEHADSSGWG